MKHENTNNNGPLEAIGKLGQTTCNLALLAGFSAALGFIAGILSAPKSGKELRKDLGDKSHEIIDKTKQQISKFNNKLTSAVDSYENRMSMAGQ